MSGARVEYFGPGMNYGSRGKVSHLTLSSSLPPYQPATYHLSGAAIAVMATYSRENGRYVEGMEGGGREGEHHVTKLVLARISLSDFPLRRFSLSFFVEAGLNRSTDRRRD